MDPSKRICLKNIPLDCTKRDIAEFVRNRTGAQPHSIDLGLDREGRVRRYAHFSVEGAKNVMSVLSGALWREVEVTALPAKPHYMYRLAEARRQRERQEAEERACLETAWKESTARWMQKTGGELRRGKPPKSFYATRQRYGEVASEIARRLREEHQRKRAAYSTREGNGTKGRRYQREEEGQQQREREPGVVAVTAEVESAANRRPQERELNRNKSNLHYKRPRDTGDVSGKNEKKQKREVSVEATQKEHQQPTGPSKEERKLSGLQAMLAALRAKMK
ncbi:hypothetical protein TraAM80_06007 [Trypanosoma rangeli]|uniref:RRM domain-containing protein n=1 Tax=Trypanosoma rangeli TaxID=5698 RepID=A0A422NCV8_TRYRA|nr:uncharacterized protein TraAM80_06007 [Trypanosoma rangeli]RNF03149.1 hypothetical protein TraAM80_06007 [Trypanosoma rangeli]|eukprot:RNF03149.1 hypothetical protein TraAM80_06007 [Trypanosoma rangeli]